MNAFHALALDLLDLVAPPRCVACSSLYPSAPSRDAPVFCAPCAIALDPAEDPPPNVLVPYAHGASLARAIHHAKYGESVWTARALGKLLAVWLRAHDVGECVVVPVPLHAARLATRGFNQAIEMARSLKLPIATDAVRRVRDTPTQVGLRRADRVANMRGAFSPVPRAALRHKSVLVLDDVVTTGATLTEVTSAVLAAGAAEVRCVALARAALDR